MSLAGDLKHADPRTHAESFSRTLSARKVAIQVGGIA